MKVWGWWPTKEGLRLVSWLLVVALVGISVLLRPQLSIASYIPGIASRYHLEKLSVSKILVLLFLSFLVKYSKLLEDFVGVSVKNSFGFHNACLYLCIRYLNFDLSKLSITCPIS